MTHNRYEEILPKLRGRQGMAPSRKLENNTYAIQGEDEIEVRLHGHTILVLYPDSSVKYDSCGWKTVTTKARLNRYGQPGVVISQKGGQWFIGKGGYRNEADWIPFEDGMTIGPGGQLPLPSQPAVDAKTLRKQVKKYVKAFMVALTTGQVNVPGPGDCFYCAMVTEDGQTLGEASHGSDHLQSHIEQDYFVPSLLVRALEVMPTSIAARHNVWAYMQQADADQFYPAADFLDKQIEKALCRYVLRQLGQAA